MTLKRRIAGGALALLLAGIALPLPVVRADGPVARPEEKAAPAYRLRSGDEISIAVTPQKEYDCGGTILADGMIYLRNIGGIKAVGLTIPGLAEQITKILDQDLVNPKVTVSLVHMAPPPEEKQPMARTLRVTVVGAVAKTGPLEIEEGTRIRKALDLCGGASKEADLTQVIILHRDLTRTIVDISTDLRVADPAHNRALQDGDSVEVRGLPPAPVPIANPVRISGQVANPGQFELKQGMTLDDLIVAGGKLTALADYEHVEIHRNGKPARTVNLLTQRSQSGQSQIVLEPGDEVFIPEFHNTVILVGAVPNPGPRAFSQGQKVRDFFLNSQDLAVFNPANVNLAQVQVIRRGQKDPQRIDLGKVLKRPSDKGNVTLESGDILFIPPRRDQNGRGVLDFFNFLSPIGFLFGRI